MSSRLAATPTGGQMVGVREPFGRHDAGSTTLRSAHGAQRSVARRDGQFDSQPCEPVFAAIWVGTVSLLASIASGRLSRHRGGARP